MIRYRAAERLRADPGWLVATVTIRIRGGESVIVPHVTVGAGHDFPCWRKLMGTCQRPACRAVIERRGSPGDRVMARRAIRRGERRSGIRMHRVVGLLPRRQMASRVAAVIRRNCQRVIVVDVAIRAGRNLPGRGQLV